tara:strand:- start:452 stop:985 length:534 start_codon:yes stop_codon:yes gene_type:complete
MLLRLQQCGLEYLDDLLHISKKTFVDAFEKDNAPDDFKTYINDAFDRDKIERELRDIDSDFYFAFVDDVLAGYFKLNQNGAQTDIRHAESIELERLYVLDTFQGKKIGQWMLDEIKKIATVKGKQFLWLGVWEKNTDAIKFYQRHDFTKFGTHPYYIGKDEQTDWLMRFDLSNFNGK